MAAFIKIAFILPAVFFLALVSAARSQEPVSHGEVLTLEKCVSIALANNPNIIASGGTVVVNESKLGEARSPYYPQVSASAGYSRNSAPVSSVTRSTVAPGHDYDQYNNSVSLTQNIYDFGKTSSQVGIQRLNLESSRSDLDGIRSQTVFNVKQAYYSVLQAKRNREVVIESIKQFEDHLEQARGFYAVGTKPRFDVTKAEVDLSNARVNLIKAENALKIAYVNLNNAMGTPMAPDYTVEDNLVFQKYDITFEDAIGTAYGVRPDLKSTLSREKASEESIELAKKGYYPALTGSAAYNWTGQKYPLDEGWNVGATVTIPLFSGFLTKYQVDESRASLDVARANEKVLRQSIYLDVQQAYLNLKAAQESIPAAELALKQAQENLDLANGRYSAGVGSPIEVTDAQVNYISAKTAYNQALYDYKVAQASLEKAMGVR